jgi:hypothetical protein
MATMGFIKFSAVEVARSARGVATGVAAAAEVSIAAAEAIAVMAVDAVVVVVECPLDPVETKSPRFL